RQIALLLPGGWQLRCLRRVSPTSSPHLLLACSAGTGLEYEFFFSSVKWGRAMLLPFPVAASAEVGRTVSGEPIAPPGYLGWGKPPKWAVNPLSFFTPAASGSLRSRRCARLRSRRLPRGSRWRGGGRR